MAAVQHSFNMNMDVTAPPTPDQERSFQSLKRSASTASLLSPPASVRKPSTKRLRAQLANQADESIHGDYLGRGKTTAVNRPKTRGTKRKVVTLRGAAAGPAERKDLNFIPVLPESLTQPEPVQHEVAPRPSTPPPRFCIPAPTAVCPQTPPRTRLNGRTGSRVCRDAPLRDSPNNPFLVEACSPPALLRPRPKRNAEDFKEGPTVGYVFRGVPTVFANPYANQCPPSPTKDKNHPSFLPIEHPDFSPCELTRPQLLFPEAHGYARAGSPSPCPPSTPKRGRARAPRTPIRRSARNNQPVMMGADQVCGPKTPEPKTPPTRMRLRGASDAAVAGEMRMMKTRSKTAAQAGKA